MQSTKVTLLLVIVCVYPASASPSAGGVVAASAQSPSTGNAATSGGTGVVVGQASDGKAPKAPQPAPPRATQQAVSAAIVQPATPECEGGWENRFDWGIYRSKMAIADTTASPETLTVDSAVPGAAVPLAMLSAEELLREGAGLAHPAPKQREKQAEQALRLYYHAKWLAERNFARAAEWRFREASRIATSAKRTILAAHALSRLGYFLIHWARPDDARPVLEASERLSTKQNPLAPFLYGVLERKTAGADVKRLLAAEERILTAPPQPSESLEQERVQLASEIRYWRFVEKSPARCLGSRDVAQVIICLSTHLFKTLFGETLTPSSVTTPV